MDNITLKQSLKLAREHLQLFLLASVFLLLSSALLILFVTDNLFFSDQGEITNEAAQIVLNGQVDTSPELSTTTPLHALLSPEDQSPRTETTTYTVQRGDSSWKIAEKFYGSGYEYVGLEAANGLKHNQHLEIGQVLTIPPQQEDQSQNSPQVDGEPDKTQESRSTYTVQPGDSLWKIAQTQFKNGTSWVHLYENNKTIIGDNPDLIYPGTTLTLPSDIQVDQ